MSGSWKVAYADFVTAMMAFFLLMWVLNMTSKETKDGLADYFKEGTTFSTSSSSKVSNNPFIQSTEKLDMRDIKMTETEKSHYAIAQKLRTMIMADAVPQSASGISADDIGVQLRINNALMFAEGSTTLLPAGRKVLQDVLTILREYNLYLVIRGHADSDELAHSAIDSSWELSGARAAAIAEELVKLGNINPTRMRAVAYGDTRPLEPGTSPEIRAKNRRVEFFFHRPEVMSYGVVY